MTISGLQKTTLIDYPERIACTVFTHGCNFRCPFCHNPELVTEASKKETNISEEEFFRFLKKRKKMLDGVVITGGEPCLQKDLVSFSQKIKDEGFLVKVDTNGSFPEAIEGLLKEKVVDYIAMDVKSSLEEYGPTSGGFTDTKKILKSIELIKNSKIEYEFRTTVVKGMHSKGDIEKIGKLLKETKNFSLQNFKYGKSISPEFSKSNEFSKEELEGFAKILEEYIENVEIKNIY
jgi:pyruvate formate lyase activating enzyme